jgi:hypothetical protein
VERKWEMYRRRAAPGGGPSGSCPCPVSGEAAVSATADAEGGDVGSGSGDTSRCGRSSVAVSSASPSDDIEAEREEDGRASSSLGQLCLTRQSATPFDADILGLISSEEASEHKQALLSKARR